MNDIQLIIAFDKIQTSILDGIIAYYEHHRELLSIEIHSIAYRITKELYVLKRLGSLPLEKAEEIFVRQAKMIGFYISKEDSAAFAHDAEYLATLVERFNLK